MPVDSTHLDYDANVTPWLRAREVFAGEDAVKSAGVRYLPKLDAQTDEAIHRAGGGVEERSAGLVRRKLIVGLRIELR